MSQVAYQYAKAFFNLALQEGALEAYKDELAAVADIYSYEQFKDFLSNPAVNKACKKQVLAHVFYNRIGLNTINLLMLLIDKNRLLALPEICSEFIKIYDKEKNILNITITSAIPLEQKCLTAICERYKELYQAASVKEFLIIDPTLLGGLKVAIGDKIYDASLKEKLLELRAAMKI